ncbi:MAG TPA: DUF2950 domain-containing protein [Tepidisphaeraceae bacterium]|nr:DUF2950 domain-containing protein [Tepidisphaeraceae bacterium]
MKTSMQGARWVATILLAGGISVGTGGCARTANSAGPTASSPTVPPAPQAWAQVRGAPAPGQLVFNSDDEAAKAIVAAAKAQDNDKVHQILGPAWKELVSGDKVEDANAFKEFAAHASEHMRLEKKDPATSILYVGNDNWPFPIPIEQAPGGKWFFDTQAGKAEILARRIGANELGTIDVCRAYVRAQRLYARKDRDASDILKYAQRLVSTPGDMDGLYWEVKPGEKPSPFGPLVAQAALEGYPTPSSTRPHPPYHGYHFRILKRQGSAAPGGKYNYIINGNLVGGFALVAFPDQYGSSGIMSFIVNQRGKVFEKDLGPDTVKTARQMTQYNPDNSWRLVPE